MNMFNSHTINPSLPLILDMLHLSASFQLLHHFNSWKFNSFKSNILQFIIISFVKYKSITLGSCEIPLFNDRSFQSISYTPHLFSNILNSMLSRYVQNHRVSITVIYISHPYLSDEFNNPTSSAHCYI